MVPSTSAITSTSRSTLWIKLSNRKIAMVLLRLRGRAQSAPAMVGSEIESDHHICEYIRRTIAQEVSHKYLRGSLQATKEAVENALSSLIITGTAEVEGGLENASYKFIETVLTDMTEKKRRTKYLIAALTAGLNQNRSWTHLPAVLWHLRNSRARLRSL